MSTKGASKQRRDLINGEILRLRDMLPLPEAARQRLSQLQIMSLACCFIRKASYFTKIFGNVAQPSTPSLDFSQSMVGFLMICSRDGKLLYISENVSEYLGHSMVDMMTQGDSIYDVIDKKDHRTVQEKLLRSMGSTEEKTFFCRMNVSRSFRRQTGFTDTKVMHVRGHYVKPEFREHCGTQPVFMATCTPLITPDVKETVIPNNTAMFHSIHSLDMKFKEIGSSGEVHLGYSESEICGKSWYELIHPDDVEEAKEKHIQCVRSSHEIGCMLTIRVMAKEGQWVWLSVVMHIRQPFVCDNSDPSIVCINQVVQDKEAHLFRQQGQLYTSHVTRSPEYMDASLRGVSPAHAITQVQLDPEQLYAGSTESMVTSSGNTNYTGMFDITITRTDSQYPGHDSNSSTSDVPVSQGRDIGFRSSQLGNANTIHGLPTSSLQQQKAMLRAGLMNRLKRKASSDSNKPQCKPEKQPRYSSGSSDGDISDGGFGGINITGTAALVSNSLVGLQDYFGSGHMGGMQIQGSVVTEAPVYAQLKEDVAISLKQQQFVTDRHTFDTMVNPLTPPDSTTTEYPEATLLNLDMCDTAALPSSMLTPASSPLYSPSYSVSSEHSRCSTEQCVPTHSPELEDLSLFPEIEEMEKKPKQLPELDQFSIEDFFDCTSAPQHCVENRALPKGTVVKSEAQDPAELMQQFSEEQYSKVMAAVTGALLDAVHLQTTPVTVADMTGCFPVASSPAGMVPDFDEGSSGSSSSPHTLSSDDEDFLYELCQLEQLTSTLPSYGEEGLSEAIFEQNL